MNGQCDYVGGCTNQVNPVVAHYILGGGSPVPWSNLPAGHQAVFTGLGCFQRCYEADAGIRGSAENHTDEFAFDVAATVAGFRVAGMLVKAGQVGLEWLGAKIVQVCASNPSCIALLVAAESGSTGGASSSSSATLVLGRAEVVRGLASEVGGMHLMDDPRWQPAFLRLMNSSSTNVIFSLEGVDLNLAQSEIASGQLSTGVNWELYQIAKHPEWWGRIQWLGGSNPFQ